MVRVPPEVHQRLALEAAEEDVSPNRTVGARLSSQVGRANVPARSRPGTQGRDLAYATEMSKTSQEVQNSPRIQTAAWY
jgi:hypothetical protein